MLVLVFVGVYGEYRAWFMGLIGISIFEVVFCSLFFRGGCGKMVFSGIDGFFGRLSLVW